MNNKKKKMIVIFLIMVLLFLAMYIYSNMDFLNSILSLTLIYIFIKFILSLMYKPYEGKKSDLQHKSVCAILPNYNEDHHTVLRAINSLLQQSKSVDQIVFVDDGSDDESLFYAIKELSRIDDRIEAYKFEHNKGKKEAQRFAFTKVKTDYVLLFDSDSILRYNSLEKLMYPLLDPKVGAVVGEIKVNNKKQNFLTNMQKLIYKSAFRFGRAAQSVTGAVSVCSGAFSIFKFDLIKENLHKFSDDFGPFKIKSGDDRLLTGIVLEAGYNTVYQSTAIAYTRVPNTLKTFINQQVRWSKSGFILSFKSLNLLFSRPIVPFWQWFDAYVWFFNWMSILVSFLLMLGKKSFLLKIGVNTTDIFIFLSYYLLYYSISNFYMAFDNLLLYISGVFYKIFYSLILIYIRFKALLTINESKWMTR